LERKKRRHNENTQRKKTGERAKDEWERTNPSFPVIGNSPAGHERVGESDAGTVKVKKTRLNANEPKLKTERFRRKTAEKPKETQDPSAKGGPFIKRHWVRHETDASENGNGFQDRG